MKRSTKHIKWFIQRGMRGWADCDWHNLDSYICKVMKGSLLHLMMSGNHLGCGIDWFNSGNDMSEEDRDYARRRHHLYERILRFFEYHELLGDHLDLHKNKEFMRKYKASGLLFIRNFGRLCD